MPLFTQHVAWFFNEKGEYDGHKSFSKNVRHFKYKQGAYNVDIENSSTTEFTVIPFILRRRRYFYNTRFSNPLKLQKFENEPPITPELYEAELEINLAKQLGDLAKGFFAKLLTPMNIFIAAVILGIIYYLGTKQHPPTPTG